jgi:hypothetical protein
MDQPPTCERHPDVETRLRCVSFDARICPDCGREAAVGFKCPDCAAHLEGTVSTRGGGGMMSRFGGGGDGNSRRTPQTDDGAGLPVPVVARASVVGIAAAVLGGLVLWPVLQGGAFFLLSAGVIGWGVARSVYWATEERNSPFVRAAAMALAGFSVAVAMGMAGTATSGSGIVFLAYPAAIYGGWIVVRQR